jgi:hypothetical protein
MVNNKEVEKKKRQVEMIYFKRTKEKEVNLEIGKFKCYIYNRVGYTISKYI